MARNEQKVLAVASGGGHWVQLLRLRSAFDHHPTTFVTVRDEYRTDLRPEDRLVVVPDATRWDKLRLIHLTLRLAWLVLRLRPDVVVSTGAAPGLIALRLAKIVGARTVWVDSIANCEQVSESGRRAGPHVDLWLTQWPHLATADGPRYDGALV